MPAGATADAEAATAWIALTGAFAEPHWGAGKTRELLVRRLDGEYRVPSISTVHAVLDRHGLVAHAKRLCTKASGTPLSPALAPNELWCTDFKGKGEFKLGNYRYCYPLTVTDFASRFLLECEALESTREMPVIASFERLLRERGMPGALLRHCPIDFDLFDVLGTEFSAATGLAIFHS
jgi:hypothetical protein